MSTGIRDDLERAIAIGRPVVLELDDGEQLVGRVEQIDDRRAEPLDEDGEVRPAVAKVARSHGYIESVDLRRIRSVVMGRRLHGRASP